MAPDTKLAFLSNLGRWGIKENEGDAEDALKHEITKAFSENRSFSFFPDKNVINHLRSGTSSQTLNSRFIEIKNDIVNTISDNNSTIKNRLLSNARLSSRIVNCISLVHQALAEINNTSLEARRFVAIKEKPGNPEEVVQCVNNQSRGNRQFTIFPIIQQFFYMWDRDRGGLKFQQYIWD